MKAAPETKPAQQQIRPAAEPDRTARTTSEDLFVDHRPEAAAQRTFADAINTSPYQIAQRQHLAAIHASPHLAAQRMQLRAMFGAAAQLKRPEDEELQMKAAPDVMQRQGPEEEELLQGKFEPVQRQGLEDEELLQGKFTPVQKVEDEELLQGKLASVQREAGLEEDELLQGKFVGRVTPIQLQSDLSRQENRTGMPDHLKSGIETLSGLSMDHVRVHYNSSQPSQLNALAYAQGTDIHVAPGQEQHLPHEAWHVVQQAQGRVQPTMQMRDGVPVNDDAGLEHEADVMGARAWQMCRYAGSTNGSTTKAIAVQKEGNQTQARYRQDYQSAARLGAPEVAVQTKDARDTGMNLAMPHIHRAALQRYVQVTVMNDVVVNAGPGGIVPAEFEAQQPLAHGQVGQVLVGGTPLHLRVSEDGAMAIEDSDLSARQPKIFYALPAVWQQSNVLLAQSQYELYCDRANAITVTIPGHGPQNLDRVLPRVRNPRGGPGAHTPGETGLGLEVQQDCIMVATAIIGNPPAAGQSREVSIAGGATSRAFGEYQTAKAMLAWARSMQMSWWWPLNWWQLLTTVPAARATAAALAEFRTALGGGPGMQAIARQYAMLQANNPALAGQVAAALRVNVHAEPGIGEAYESYQLGLPTNFVAGPGPDFEADPTGATMASLTSHGPGRPVRHGWGQHIGAVVAMSAGNRMTLQNYARAHEQGSLRAGPDYYFQMYGPPHLPQQTWHYAWTAGARAAGIPPVKNAVTVVVRQ